MATNNNRDAFTSDRFISAHASTFNRNPFLQSPRRFSTSNLASEISLPVSPERVDGTPESDFDGDAVNSFNPPESSTDWIRNLNLRIGEPAAIPPLEVIRGTTSTVGAIRRNDSSPWGEFFNAEVAAPRVGVAEVRDNGTYITGILPEANRPFTISEVPSRSIINSQSFLSAKHISPAGKSIEDTLLDLIRNKLNLKVETQWEGKNIAVKVSLRVTETDEELLSDVDTFQNNSDY